MGGEIGVVSSPGAGSTFWFSVRLGRSAGIPSPSAPRPDQDVTGHSGGARVLVVEDNPVNQRILVKTLEREGYRVDLTATGTAAVQAVADNRYHAVLMDCQMPEMDGYEATRLVRMVEGGQRHTPIIAITASAMVTDRDRCLAAGMDDFVSKPVSRLQLLQVISRWTAGGEQGRPVESKPAEASGTPPEASAAPPALPPVDYSVLDDLRAALGERGEEVYRELIDLFLGDAPISFGGMEAALVGREAELFARAAHRLRGSASSFGAQRLIELCTEAEELGWANDLPAAAPMVPLVREELTRVELALRGELTGSR